MVGNTSLKPIIMFFVAVVLAVVFIQVLANNIKATETIETAVNESVTVTVTTTVNESIDINSSSGATANGDLVNISFFGNGTNNSDQAGVTLGLNVNFTRNGTIVVSGEFFDATNANYNITYRTSTGTAQLSLDTGVTSVTFFGDADISTQITGVDVGEEINFTEEGVLTLNFDNFTKGDYNASFQYENALFVSNSAARTLLKLVVIFFALVFIGFSIKGMREAAPKLFDFR